MSDEIKAWVLWHRYSDGSGASIFRVYLDKERAEQDHDLISAHPSGSAAEWHLDETFVYGDAP